MALSKIIKEGVKTVAKRGRKTKAQRAAATRAKNAATKKVEPKKQMAMKPGTARKRAEGTPKGTLAGMTAKQKSERTRLINNIKKEMEMQRKGITPKPKGQKMVTTVPRAADEKLTDLSINMVPASLIELPPSLKGYSKQALRRLIQTGQAKLVKKGNKYEVKNTGRYAPPASMIAEAAGEGPRALRGTGRKMPSLRQRLEKAQRAGEPTSQQALKERQADLAKPKTLGSAQAMNQARRSVKKEQEAAVNRIETLARKHRAEVNQEKKQGKITVEDANNKIKKINADAEKDKQIVIEKLRKTVHSKARNIKSDPLQYEYRSTGGDLKSKYPKPPMQNLPYKPRRKKPLTPEEREKLIKKGPYKPTRKKPLSYEELKEKGIIQLYNKGGKVGSKPRGCGAAVRGYGKAMKGSK